jgi:uncharacterized protein YraI
MKRRAFWWVIGSVLLSVWTALFVIETTERLQHIADLNKQRLAVTASVETSFRTGNSQDYPQRLDGALPAGVELSIRAERGGWFQVQLAGGPVGWVPKDAVVIVK